MEQDTAEQGTELMSAENLLPLPLPLIIFAPGSGTRSLIDDGFRCSGHILNPVMEQVSREMDEILSELHKHFPEKQPLGII